MHLTASILACRRHRQPHYLRLAEMGGCFAAALALVQADEPRWLDTNWDGFDHPPIRMATCRESAATLAIARRAQYGDLRAG